MEQLTPDERRAAQEKSLDAVNCELSLLRQHMDARFAQVDQQFVATRLEMQLFTKEEMGKAASQLTSRIDALQERMESNNRWIFGLLVTNLASLIALAARGLFG